MATTNVQSAGGIFIAVDADVAPFFARIAETASKAKTQGESIGQALGQGIASGIQRSVAAVPGLVWAQVQRSVAPIPGLNWSGQGRAITSGGLGISTGQFGGTPISSSGGFSRNMAADMGLGNNFVFAIQDATSAVGQFGLTTTGLRFAILGATNNIQILVMQAALAGVTFRNLLSFITPLHVGLALFSAGISLLPLLFKNTSDATKETTDRVDQLNKSLAENLQIMRERANLRPQSDIEAPMKPGQLLGDIVRAQSATQDEMRRNQATIRGLNEAIAVAEKQREAAMKDEEAGMEIVMISKNIQNAKDNIAKLSERNALLEAQHVEQAERRAELEKQISDELQRRLSMGRPGSIYEAITKSSIDALHDAVRKDMEGMKFETEDEKLDRFRKSRDFPLQMQRLDMELARIQKDQFTTKFESPESIVKSIQAEADSGIERNQEKQIRLQEIQNQKADLIIDTIKNTGGLPGLAFILP